jgi:hypothetical protein
MPLARARALRLLLLPSLLFLLIPAPPDGVPEPYARARADAAPLAAGLHAPNRPWREPDYARMTQGAFGAVKLMSYHPLEAYDRLRRDNPRLEFAVRLHTPWNELPPPEQFAAAHVPYLRQLADAGYALWVEIGNEPNLELHPRAEAAFAEWYEEVLRGLRAAVPAAKYGFPGLAHDRREDAWLEASAAAVAQSDWLGVHAYWRTEREMLDPQRALKLVHVHRRFPALPLLVTEAGNYAPGVTPAEQARQYARFTRTLARLPYVRAVHYFILSGTPEWQRFFFDDQILAAVAGAAREPVPLLAGLSDARRYALALAQPLFAPRAAGVPPPTAAPRPAPPPEPVSRRRLLADASPGERATGLWTPLAPAAPPAAGLRTSSGYLGTHFSARLELAPPVPGAPLALQFAESDLFDPLHPTDAPRSSGPRATGFALLWDGEGWRLQYHRDGALAADLPLAGVPTPEPRGPPGTPGAPDAPSSAAGRGLAAGVEGADTAAGAPAQRIARPTSQQTAPSDQHDRGGWYRVELVLEPRSAAAWVWHRGAPQPAEPNAVFAPPEAAGEDGARPRALFLPAHPVASLVLEGATRDP